MIGAPTVSSPSTIGAGINGKAFLVFGSRTVNAAAITDWIGTTSNARSRPPTPPTTVWATSGSSAPPPRPTPSRHRRSPFPSPASRSSPAAATSLGPGCLGLVGQASERRQRHPDRGPVRHRRQRRQHRHGSRLPDLGQLEQLLGQTINLATPTKYSGLNIVTFVNTATGGQLGYSVAGGINIFGDGSGDIILGAPTRPSARPPAPAWSTPSRPACSAAATQTIDVSTIGQSGSTSVIFSGATAGSQAGWTVADAGNVNGVTSGGTNVDDLLIGAPSRLRPGAAYLVYGGSTSPACAQTVNGVRYINLANVGGRVDHDRGGTGRHVVGPERQQDRLGRQLRRRFQRRRIRRHPHRLAPVLAAARP